MSLHRSTWILFSLATLAGCAATPSAIDATSSSSESASNTLDARAESTDATHAPTVSADSATSGIHASESSGPLVSHDAWEPWSSSSSLSTAPFLAPAPAPMADSDHYGGMKGDWEITLGGTANNDKNFDVGSFAATGSVGLFLTDAFEVSLRQNVSFASPSIFNGATRGALDFNLFPGNAFRPVIGGNIGYVYGDSVQDTWSAAPEAGFKFYLQKRAFIEALMEYQFFFNKGDEIGNAFNDGQFVYTLVLGLNF